MEEVHYGIKLSDGCYLRIEQESSTKINIYSVKSIANAELWDEKFIEEAFENISKGSDGHFDFNYMTDSKPKKIVRVTIEVEDVN